MTPAMNTVRIALANICVPSTPTESVQLAGSAIARSDGTVLCYQSYGCDGLLIADLDLTIATGILASRCRTSPL